jgi:MoaA/NifB/PqqE/SkfB family radical SAM enzyme
VNDQIKKIYIEITTRCNLDCTTCLRRLGGIENQDMSDDTFRLFIERIKEAGLPEKVVFAGYGEPLLHPKVLRLFARLKELGIAVELITNGMLLDEKMAARLVELQVDAVYVSLDGIVDRTYRAIRCGGDLAGVKQNILELRRQRASARFPRIIGEMVMTRDNLSDVPVMIENREELGFDELMFSHLVPHTYEMNERILYDGKGKISSELLRLLKRNAFRLADDGSERAGCDFVKGGTISVSAKGEVHPCMVLMHDYGFYRRDDFRTFPATAFGSLKENSLKEIWGELQYRRLREDMQDDIESTFPDCPGCYYNGACFDRGNAKSDCYGHPTPCSDCLWLRKVALCP